MNIRSKIILITLPLIITPLILTLIVATLSARNGITVVATELLTFKTEVLTTYMENQWTLLTNNDLDKNQEYVDISKSAVEGFSKTLVGSSSEVIFAVDGSGDLMMESSEITLTDEDKSVLREMMKENITGWQHLSINGNSIIAETSFFEPFGWYLLVTVERDTFYGAITQIFIRTAMIFVISLVLTIILLIFFSSYLTKPLEQIVEAIKNIITTNDLSTRVSLQYKDETGKLGHYFNIMTGELDKAYNQMKSYALQAVVAKHKEMKIRNIFQKYVPKDVIDKFFTDPESMLTGENRVLAILFSDIRSFTTISEGLAPDELVES
ncbi:MAG: HAMP domain-containing protein, partial [Spirochaetales bacterium]|nr:HAMP domain-containing protein [Spirochaetales bacterium]